MRALLDLMPPREICRTVECGNAAQRNGFCRDCVSLPTSTLVRRVLLFPIAILARILEI